MNSTPENSNPEWLPCSEGTIGAAGEIIRTKQNVAARRQFLKSATTAAIFVAGAGVTGWTLMGRQGSTSSFTRNPAFAGGIGCSDVLKNLDAYVAQTISDKVLVAAIDEHLTLCDHCRIVHDDLAGIA